MDSKIDTVREAIDEIQNIKWLIDEGPAHVKLTEAQVRLTELKAALSAIDPKAIRTKVLMEAADRAVAWQVNLCSLDDWSCERCTECNQLRYVIMGNNRG